MTVYRRDVQRDFGDHLNVDGGPSRGAYLGDQVGRRAGAGEAGEAAARERDLTTDGGGHGKQAKART